MIEINKNFNKLEKNYLFAQINQLTQEYKAKNPKANIIKLGIGDVTLPICDVVLEAMHKAVDEMGDEKTFRGYGPYEGYEFLRKTISNSYLRYGINIGADEIYVSDGAKSDTANIIEIFNLKGNVLIPNPTYPVYVDSNILAGNNICYIEASESNNFLPVPNNEIKADLIYLCSPNNPTGAVYSKEELKKWVDYALKNKAIILFDAAYEPFIDDENFPHSIFEIEGAKECAVESCSFSKGAGFTGIRCGYVTIPNELKLNGMKVGDLWLRRQSMKFNGVSYITQKGAEAALSEDGRDQILKNINYYKGNAKILSEALKSIGIWHIGGKNSPYIWMKCPGNMKSWEFFDFLLNNAGIVGTPGSGFGNYGEGYFRFSSFGNREDVLEAASRFMKLNF